jgi:sialic acid synthase SpsE
MRKIVETINELVDNYLTGALLKNIKPSDINNSEGIFILCREKSSKVFRRSLFVVCDMHAGEKFTEKNVRSTRSAFGLHPRYTDKMLGRKAKKDISRGTPLSRDIIAQIRNGIKDRLFHPVTHTYGSTIQRF